MANFKFMIRDTTAKIPQTINLRYQTREADFKYPLEMKILPKYWNKDSGRVKNVTAILERQAINEFLNELSDALENYRIRCIAKKEVITPKSLHDFVSEHLAPTNANEKTLFGYFEAYIEQTQNRLNTKTGKHLSKSSFHKLTSVFAELKAFEKAKKRSIDFADIDVEFYEDFTAFLTKKGFAINTIGNKVKALKSVLNSATERGINKNLAYKSKRFVAMSEDSENIYLTETELQQMAEIDFSNNARLERVRDLFLLGAYTGLRFSDFTRITAENIENDTIKLHQQKTGGKVIIPLHSIVKNLLKQYEGKAPKVISNQKMNEYLKEIGQQIPALLERVSKTITKGGKQVTEHFSKWELLSTHTARRSFATNLFKTGFPAQSIMQITGHRTEKAFLKYIKVTQEEHAERLAEHWKQNNKLKIA